MGSVASGHVAVLIDFENVVRGLAEQDRVHCGAIMRLAEEYGRVLVANAYADWRGKEVYPYQGELYRLGFELVQVLGMRRPGGAVKNGVDMRIAVDAMATLRSLPHLDTYVIVSADRDFTHVMRALRREGKVVIGISPLGFVNSAFASHCDRFLQFESLLDDREGSAEYSDPLGGKGSGDLEELRRSLVGILAQHPEGIKGAMVKPLLRRVFSPTFDERHYGAARLADLLRGLPDICVVGKHETDGDVTIRLAESLRGSDGRHPRQESHADCKIRESNLGFYRYERDPGRRRDLLRRLYQAMSREEHFTWTDVERELIDTPELREQMLTATILARYRTVIFQNRGFEFAPDQETVPQRDRLTRLRDHVRSADDLIRLYELGVAYKVIKVSADEDLPTPPQLAEILGLVTDDPRHLGYAAELLDQAVRIDDSDE